MSACDDLLEKAKRTAKSIRFDEICKLAECFEFQFDRQKGSHRIHKRAGFRRLMNFQEGRNGMAVPYQVRDLLRAIEELDGMGEDEEEE
ncbi:MAG: type II toxin-antitoxin system HicA family toxin [Gemmatimonadota bacterium]|nr:type II toxin-antitoxin system HicA family toxin [Gemmatimonadota bacterium]